MNGTKKLTLAMLLALGAGNALALGLGQIKVESGLHEPLRAVIPVLSDDPAELRNLKVALASRDEFERAGLSFSRFDVPLEFAVVKQPDGDTVIEVTTDKPVDEPAVGFLLAVNWANGKLLREYSVLLDPPHIAPITTTTPRQVAQQAAVPEAPAEAPPVVEAPAPAEPEPSAAPAVAEAPEAAEAPERSADTSPAVAAPAAAAPQPLAADSSIGDSYSVVAGDTLWEIASRVQADTGVGINRAMIAIQRANPDAFYRDNINVLKKGSVLRIPGADELAAVSGSAARAAVAAQHAAWIGQKSSQPTLVARSGDASASAGVGGSGSGDRLELVAPGSEGGGSESRAGDQSGTGSAVVADLRQELARSKEALASEQQKTEDLTARVESLEDLKQKSGSLLELKDSEIAELQQQLKAAREAAAAASVAAPATAAVASTTAAPADSASAALAEDIFAGGEEPATAASLAAPATTAAEPAVAASAATAATTGLAPAASATISTAALAEQPVAEPADVETAQQPAAVETVPAETRAAQAKPWYMQTWAWIAGAAALLLLLLGAWWSRRGGGQGSSGSIADQFSDEPSDDGELGDMGDDEYALIEELEQRPDDLSLHLELASLYYAMRDQNKFEDAAESMYSHVDDPEQAEWQQVRAMGEELSPDHPLFADLHADSSGDSFDSGQEDEDLSSVPPPMAAADSGAGDEAGSEYNYDIDVTPGARGASASETAQEADEFAEPPPPPPAEEPSLAEMAGDAADGDADEGGYSTDPIDTKLDLARAYQDMGDEEGARAMLEEVIAEGSEAQKDTARQLLKDL